MAMPDPVEVQASLGNTVQLIRATSGPSGDKGVYYAVGVHHPYAGRARWVDVDSSDAATVATAIQAGLTA